MSRTTEARAGATPHMTRYVLGIGTGAGDRDCSRSSCSLTAECLTLTQSRMVRQASADRRSDVRQTGGDLDGRRTSSEERTTEARRRARPAVRSRVQGPAGGGDPASARLRPLAVGQPRPRRRSRPGNAAQGLGGAQALPGRHQHARLDLHHPAQPVPQPDAPRPLQGRMGRDHRRPRSSPRRPARTAISSLATCSAR